MKQLLYFSFIKEPYSSYVFSKKNLIFKARALVTQLSSICRDTNRENYRLLNVDRSALTLS